MPKMNMRNLIAAAVCACVGLIQAAPVQAETTLQKVRREGVIRVGYANEAPYAFTGPDGHLTGESPTVFAHVMKQLGVNKVEGVQTEWGSLIPGLKAGRFDAIVASMYITPKRCRQVAFANPTYGIGESFVVLEGNPHGLKRYSDAVDQDLKLAFVAGTAEIAQAKLAGVGFTRRVVVPDFAAGIAAVRAGRVAGVALTALTAKNLASKDDTIDATEPFTFVHGGKAYRAEGSFAFRKQDKALQAAVNAQLATFIGSDEHLALVAPFGFDRTNLPAMTAAQHCAGR